MSQEWAELLARFGALQTSIKTKCGYTMHLIFAHNRQCEFAGFVVYLQD